MPNYSFENSSVCPSSAGQLYLATPWIAIPINDLEYLNVCSTDPTYSVPYQGIYNYQQARTGDAFIFFLPYNGPGVNKREYAQVQLMDTLKSNTCYYVEFFVNRAPGLGGKYAVNNIGCVFTDSSINNTGTGYVLNLIPDILEFNNSIITDTLNWVRIFGIYNANGGENYITIGNFFDDVNTDTIDMFDETYPGAGYFIDDVSVIPIDSISGGMPAYAGADTNVILGDSVFIGQQISNLNCNWYNAIGGLIANGTSGIYVSPTTSTFYVVEQNLCGVITYDTVNVTVLPVSIYELQNNNSVQIYPNPNNGSFTIEHNLKKGNYVLEIVDLMGKIVHSENIITKKQTINTEQLSTGLYLVNFKSNTDKLMYLTKMSVIN